MSCDGDFILKLRSGRLIRERSPKNHSAVHYKFITLSTQHMVTCKNNCTSWMIRSGHIVELDTCTYVNAVMKKCICIVGTGLGAHPMAAAAPTLTFISQIITVPTAVVPVKQVPLVLFH